MAQSSRIAIIGSGQSGLVTAKTLLDDGFTNVTVFGREKFAGGTWAKDKLYPGLVTNGAYYEFRFSSLDYTAAEMKMANPYTSRIDGDAVASYLQRFADTYLNGHMRLQTQIDDISRPPNSSTGWQVTMTDLARKETTTETFDKVVVCSGKMFLKKIPEALIAQSSNFKGPIVHTGDLGKEAEDVLNKVRPRSDLKPGRVVILGGGKSAADAAVYFAKKDRNVTLVMREFRWFIPLSSKSKPPDFIRRSRFPALVAPNADCSTRLERFLHHTRLGAKIIQFIFQKAQQRVWNQLKLEGPLRPRTPLLWGGQSLGPIDPDNQESVIGLIKSGRIEVVTPAHAIGFGSEGDTVLLDHAQVQSVEADALILGTGFQSSYAPYLSTATLKEAGLEPQPPPSDPQYQFDWSQFPILKSRPFPVSNAPLPLMVHGLVPALTFDSRDFAMSGYSLTLQGFYLAEVSSHWISSYFLDDPFLTMNRDQAIYHAERASSWLRQRYSTRTCLKDPITSCNTGDALANWPHLADKMLQDMQLPIWRSGTSFFSWPFKTVDSSELATLSEERRSKRTAALKSTEH